MKKLSKSGGFTLIEVLVALTLMAIGILAVVQMQLVALKANTIAQRLTVATNITQEVMDYVQSWDVNSLPRLAPANAFTAPPANATAVNFRFLTGDDPSAVAIPTLFFPDSGTFRAFYTITLNADGNTAVIAVDVCLDDAGAAADARCGNVAGRRRLVGITSFKRIV